MSEDTSFRDRALALLGGVLVLLSLGWIGEVHRFLGLLLFTEQALITGLGVTLAIGILMLAPARPGPVRALAWAAAAAILALMMLAAVDYQTLGTISIRRPAWLAGAGALVLLLMLGLVWRLVGLTIGIILLGFTSLALFGDLLGMPSSRPDRLAIYLALDPGATLGLPLRVAIEIVVPFVFFGQLVQVAGGGDYLTRLAGSVFGRYRGGPAKVAIGASALFGSISGNAVSNVVGTGIVTIPMMKRAGFRPETAGAVEAVASTGGQLMPPVMGAAAFVMADYMRVPYGDVLTAALLPAILYFAAVFIQVDRIAGRMGIEGAAPGSLPSFLPTLAGGLHLLLPFGALFVAFLGFDTRPERAALVGIGTLVLAAMAFAYEGKRLTPGIVARAAADAGIAAAVVVLLAGAAGILIGLVNVTGLSFSLATKVVALSGGNTVVLLLMVALAAVVLGMGMPTVAVYVLLATLLVPALVEAGIGEMQAHLFILYFGMMSMITPPIAMASITAANLAGASPWTTSWEALKLAWVAYLVPFFFAFSPALILQGSAGGIALAAGTALLGVHSGSLAIAGFGRRPLRPWERVLFGLAGLCLIVPPDRGAWAMALNAAGAACAILGMLLAPGCRRSHPPEVSPRRPSSAPRPGRRRSGAGIPDRDKPAPSPQAPV
jgi:TRAP transporter 4TM/12TM fusion protein